VTHPIQVLIADDSALMRTLLRELLSTDLDIHVMDMAQDGVSAIEMVACLHPDVLVMDVEMPRLSGLEALRQIMGRHPLPVIIISGLNTNEFIAQALELGAIDVVCKPSGTISVDIYKIQDELITKVKVAAQVDVRKLLERPLPVAEPLTSPPPPRPVQGQPSCITLIAASTGGPRTLERLLIRLPAELPSPIVVVQHMPAEFTRSFAGRLNERCALQVQEASEADVLAPGQVYVAPGGYHTRLIRISEKGFVTIHLDHSSPVHSLRPRADLTMTDAAHLFGERCLGVVLTGMGDDGTAGLAEICQAGGMTIAQDQETSAIYGMPKAAADNQVAQLILSPDEIAAEIVRWSARWS